VKADTIGIRTLMDYSVWLKDRQQCEGDRALQQSKTRDRHHDKEASLGKRRHRVKTHLTDDDARLEEASILARRDGSLWQSRQGLPPQGRLP
jgi:hypothetical protein